jgi:hypothetical protein
MIAVSSNSIRQGVLAAALALTGTAALAQQQQFANLDDERRAYLSAQCDHISDGAEQIGCLAAKSIEFNRAKIHAAKQGIAASDALRPCLDFLKGKRDAGTVFDRAITRENACPYARELGMRDGPS